MAGSGEQRERRGAVPRYRATGGPAILSQGFRPFFLVAGLWAVAAMGLFLAMLAGLIGLAGPLDGISWHVHEMLFGVVGAALAGFLLTAIPNWTGRLPLQGASLALLVGLWLLARLALGLPLGLPPGAVLILALAFPATLLAACAREIVAGRAWRNLPLIAALAVLLLADGLYLADRLGLVDLGGWPMRLGLGVFAALVSLIGGRIIPSFTGNWLKARGEAVRPASFGPFDRAALLLTVVALIAWVAVPEGLVTGGACALAALVNGARLARWQGHRVLAEPLLAVLHLGYSWLVVSLGLLGASAITPAIPQVAALHALTVGAMGTMILAVMSRATLGHTGRRLTSRPGLTAAFAFITLAALARVAAPVMGTDALLLPAGLAWIAAFVCFLWVTAPLLLGPRPVK